MGMSNHLKIYGITADSHQRRLMGYLHGPGTYTEADLWSGKLKMQARLLASKAMR